MFNLARPPLIYTSVAWAKRLLVGIWGRGGGHLLLLPQLSWQGIRLPDCHLVTVESLRGLQVIIGQGPFILDFLCLWTAVRHLLFNNLEIREKKLSYDEIQNTLRVTPEHDLPVTDGIY